MPILLSGKPLVNQSVYVGEIRLFPYRIYDLPNGWYFANGDRYSLDSPQGKVLNNLSNNYKQDFNIYLSNDTVNLPNMFYIDGRGMFIRPSNTISNIQNDQIRPIIGFISGMIESCDDTLFKIESTTWHYAFGSSYKHQNISFNTSRLGINYNGNDTHPLNIGFTPSVFLGV